MHEGNSTPSLSRRHRLCWCPYMPVSERERLEAEAGGGDSPAMILAVSRHSVVEVIQVDEFMPRQGGAKGSQLKLKGSGRLQSASVGFAFSQVQVDPTGTTLAAVPEEAGRKVEFFRFNFHGKWRGLAGGIDWDASSHLGESDAVSGVWFLDDLGQKCSEDLYWRHALVGEKHNSVLSIWNLVNWSRMQTLKLSNPSDSSRNQRDPDCFEIAIDPGARFAVAASQKFQGLVFIINFESGTTEDESIASLRFCAVRQLNFLHPVQTVKVLRSKNPGVGYLVIKHGNNTICKYEVAMLVEDDSGHESIGTREANQEEKEMGSSCLDVNANKCAKKKALSEASESDSAELNKLRREVVVLRATIHRMESRLLSGVESSAERNLALMETLKKEMEEEHKNKVVSGVLEGMEAVCVHYLVPEMVERVQAAFAMEMGAKKAVEGGKGDIGAVN